MVSSSAFLLLTLSNLLHPVVSAPGVPQAGEVYAESKRDVKPSQNLQSLRLRQSKFNGSCALPVDVPTAAKIPTPFIHFSEAEINSIVKWLSAPERGLNLTDAASPDLMQTDNYIWLLEPLKPNKTEVLAYLDNGAPAPQSYAHVILVEGGKANPDVGDYYVGPLPISNQTKIRDLDYINNGRFRSRIPYNARPGDGPVALAQDAVIASTMSKIADITADLMGMVYYGANDNRTNSVYLSPNPTSGDGSYNYVWTSWRRAGLAPHDTPSDLYISFDMSGSDSSLYKVRMILYNMVLYSSVDEFRDAWKNGKIKKSPPPGLSTDFLKKDRKGPVRELEDRLAPITVSPDGRRYKLDTKNKYVEYLGWSFYTRFDRDVGVQIFDIKFKGERIMYELSLQDAIAQYAGSNPGQAGTAFSDRFYGIGTSAIRLIPGYDCPYHASYWNATFNDKTSRLDVPGAICIFESDLGYPVTRHNDPAYKQSTKGSKLTVRMIATVGNYDYLFDYSFWVDGTIAVDARASGYVQGNYYRTDEEGKWGPRINDTVSGSLHTHVMNFKADFDLIDTKNTFLKTDLIVENVTHPWYPERGGTFESFRYNFTEIQTEDEGLLPAPINGQTMYTIINKDKKNQWGEPRGYRILPGISNIHLAARNSPFFLKSAQFAKQPFAVSRQHDTEPASTSTMMQNLPLAPPVEFYKFFNGESLVQEDLVAWINLGMHHYTRAEDIPNTVMTEAHSSIMFAPQNWGNTELTTDLSNAVIYNRNADGSVVEPETNGVNPPQCFPMSPLDSLAGVFEQQSTILAGTVISG